MDKKKICSVCGTQNEEEYIYCKNCGTPLNLEPNAQNAQYTPHPNFNSNSRCYEYGSPFTDYAEIAPELEGVDTNKVSAYVGMKNRDKFMRMFIAAAKTGRKIFFNWPVAICGLLLSIPFSAAWFFYRKMYKVGLIICAVSLAISVCVTAVNFNENYASSTRIYESIKDMSDEDALNYYIEQSTASSSAGISNQSAKSKTVAFGISILQIAGVVLLSVFAHYIYYKHTLKDVKRLSDLGETQPYVYAIAGKPSIAPAILIPIAFNLLATVIAFTPYIPMIINGAEPLKVFIAAVL